MTRSQLRAILVELQFLESMPDTLGLAFSIVLRSEAPPTSNRSPASVRYYIGCAHLLKRELFLQLGAYDESFHCGEEPEFCLRALHKGYRVYLYPGVVIRHNRSPGGAKSQQDGTILYP